MNLAMPWNTSKPANNGWTAPIEDVKQQIGQQVDHLAQVAAQIGRDVAQQAAQVSAEAGSQAAGAARDLSAQAIKATQGAGSQAAAVVREVPSGATSLLQQIMQGAAQFGREARSIRVTREPAPAPRGPDVLPGVTLLAGVGSGLALMYFFDPGEGRRRRALLREQLGKWTRVGRKTAAGKAVDLRNRTVGLAHEARKQVTSITGTTEAQDQPEESGAYTNGASGSNGHTYGVPIETGEQTAPDFANQPQTSEVG
jgi:hypothetical protein